MALLAYRNKKPWCKIFNIFLVKMDNWLMYGTTGKSGQGYLLPLSLALLAYRNKKPWSDFLQYFLSQNGQFGQTTELQENPDSGQINHFPWLYWPTWIKNIDVHFSIFLGQNVQFGQTTELQEYPDRGDFYHCLRLYWPTGIKNIKC